MLLLDWRASVGGSLMGVGSAMDGIGFLLWREGFVHGGWVSVIVSIVIWFL